MNASTRKCTDAKPCQLMNCYACRCRLINETATAMLVAGTDQDSVEEYRYAAINALAFEIETPKPKAPKAKAPVLKHSEAYYAQTARAVRNATTRQDAEKALADHTVNDLKRIWTLTERTDAIPSKLRKAQVVTYMIENLVGYRLDTDVILNAK